MPRVPWNAKASTSNSANSRHCAKAVRDRLGTCSFVVACMRAPPNRMMRAARLRAVGGCMKSTWVTALTAWAMVCSVAQAADSKGDWKPLFNGKNLKGWSVHYASKTAADAPPPSTLFAVENGAIHVYPTQAVGSTQPNAYLETDTELKDYVVSLEYKWGEKKFPPRADQVGDAGLLYNGHRERAGDGPAGAEAQIQEGDTGDSWAVSSRLSSFVNPKTGLYTLPEEGGVPVTVGNDGKFERTRH